MKDRDKTKICILTQSLSGGGAERSVALLTQLLDAVDFEVHVVTVLDGVDFPYAGQLHNLGRIRYSGPRWWSTLQRLRYLRALIQEEQFDWIIDNRPRVNRFRESVYNRFILPLDRTLFVVRSARLSTYIPDSPWMISHFYAKAARWVCVSKEIATHLQIRYGLDNVTTIHNAVQQLKTSGVQVHSAPYLLAYGRLEDKIKNYSLLLEAFARSGVARHGMHLIIMGDGPDKAKLMQKSVELGLEAYVRFLPYVATPGDVVSQARFVTLTSRYEGFPRVLIEALALGVPVVSVDCSSGPKEIVQDGENGLLVPNHQVDKLAKAFHRMVNDHELYAHLKKNAAASVAHLAPQHIAAQWQQLLTHEDD
ncbi:glycosyltransferase [Croceiramulus getboli]|nr:glycosyltransferase [Flavobacteriaceae bacterium YJPT1-3]